MVRPNPLFQIHVRKQLARPPVRPAHHILGQITTAISESRHRHTGHPLFQHPARAFGHISLSGLGHQLDGALGCFDALVLAEWKAYRGKLPKNELLRFKAATDDYYTARGHSRLSRPVFRIFGGVGTASDSLRAYAALHGIALIDSDRWPLALLAASDFIWPQDPTSGPPSSDRRTLCWGIRSMQSVLRPHVSGGVGQ